MRRSFSVEFKRDAADLIIQQGYSITEACRAVDVDPTALARWVKQLRAERGKKNKEKEKKNRHPCLKYERIEINSSTLNQNHAVFTAKALRL